jgi:hypothetical protein
MDYKNINTASLPQDVAEVFNIIKTDTENFTNDLAIKAYSENLDKLMELINNKFPEAVTKTKLVVHQSIPDDKLEIKSSEMPGNVWEGIKIIKVPYEQFTSLNQQQSVDIKYAHPILKKLKNDYDNAKDQWHKDRVAYETAINLSGDSNKAYRQEIMSAIKGYKVPVAKCGMTVLSEEFEKFLKESEQPGVETETKPQEIVDSETTNLQAEIEGLKILMDIADTKAEKANLQAEIEGLQILIDIQ